MNAERDEPRWDALDVAKYLGMSRSWVYEHLGEIPHHRYGSALRFEPEKVRAYGRGERPSNPSNLVSLSGRGG